MPTRKQRRRREKERRHEWEVVYVDDEGREVEPPPEQADERPRGRAGSPRDRPAKGGRGSGRGAQPPSWRRVLKRAGLFAPIMFVMIYVLEPSASPLAKVVYTLQLVLLFIPFSYLVDSMTYRVWRRRLERSGAAAPAARKR